MFVVMYKLNIDSNNHFVETFYPTKCFIALGSEVVLLNTNVGLK